ncbi:pimeloyl-ACP methyl ester carboxylesterase [Arthrobacter globiformis]|uniref:alpha/beta fold hydrolase n=1 Tax=Arthrobacter globiformis TaxID=1665 RepID=UPI00277DD692|nr:alpha/beta hydrolase [Arthrobacter globiformis]MDQ1056180.1 pimeloyl-ACP methyl ester carboxylesterase [Arthrobacter globiformis]
MRLADGVAVTANGLTGRLYTSNAPSGAGQPAYVLLHGIGVSHRYLARLHVELAQGAEAPQSPQAECLDRGAAVYSFDLPGFGGMPRPGRQVTVGEYAAFVATVLAERGVESCIVIGHSMGVQFAVELALQVPGLVTRTVLMGPVVDPARRSAAWHALALTRDSLFSEPPLTNVVVFTDYFRTGFRWYLTELPVMMEYPLDSRLRGVAQPVLVLRGGRDPIARRPWCEYLAAQATDGAFAEVSGRGHVVQDTATGEVAQAIRRWAGTAAEGSAAAGGSTA